MLKHIKLHMIPGVPSRSVSMIEQGLKNHPNVDLVDHPEDAEFSLLTWNRYKPGMKTKTIPADNLVYIDFSDKGELQPPKAVATFRRCSPQGTPFYPITFAVMDQFIRPKNVNPIIDLGCYLRKHPWHLRRDDVIDVLKKTKWKDFTMIIRPVNNAGRGEFNKEYFDTLYNTRINVTCTPYPYSLGDWRTWECLVSGATVFMDTLTIPFLQHPVIPNLHYISYDPGSKKGLDEFIEKLEFHMNYNTGPGDLGRDFVLKHHRSMNRVDNILSIISPEHVCDP